MGYTGFLTTNQRRNFRQLVIITIVSVLLGIIYVIFSDGFRSIDPYINGVIGGLLGGLFIGILELYILGRRTRKRRFLEVLIIRSFAYVFFLFFMLFHLLLFYRVFKYNSSYTEVLSSEEFEDYLFNQDFPLLIIYALLFAFAINFTRQMGRKVGYNVLMSFITGTYHQPVVEERIFMFLHIVNSDKISKKLGLERFFSFLNDFIYDITDSILKRRAVFYQYVEDEIVISWAMEKGKKDCNCLRTFFDITAKMELLKEKYFEKYKVVPDIVSALHTGSVVRAEIGDVKSEIVFHGDAMNTCSRILDQCIKQNSSILFSQELLDCLTIPSVYTVSKVGEVQLKGKEKSNTLYSVELAALKNY